VAARKVADTLFLPNRMSFISLYIVRFATQLYRTLLHYVTFPVIGNLRARQNIYLAIPPGDALDSVDTYSEEIADV
jgi:hypothetical protein